MAVSFEGKLLRNLKVYGERFGAVVLMYAATKASEEEAKMKMNRPWTDRTNMAKATLSCRVSQPDATTVRMTFAHGVDYGVWLELANAKNYAIVGPTIRQDGPKIVEGLNGITAKIKI